MFKSKGTNIYKESTQNIIRDTKIYEKYLIPFSRGSLANNKSNSTPNLKITKLIKKA